MNFFTGLLWLVLLLVRGVLLWLFVPFAVLAWLTVHWWAQKASVAQAVCWYDQILWAFLILIPFRALRYIDPKAKTVRCLRLSEMRDLKAYKISLINDVA
ncbi:hypothetical protein CQ045_18555 [Microbacterium sp. MYb66]|jgi:hypothetical protein|nr:hypothetical protein CQ045_18555 [Microbacterium sp. MYb66]